MFDFIKNFKWEQDDYLLELVRLDELGFPESWNFVVPDKFMHFAMPFLFVWVMIVLLKYIPKKWVILEKKTKMWIGLIFSFLFWVPYWEFYLDGCTRYGASWRDLIFDFLGLAFAWFCFRTKKIGQTDESH